MLDLLYFDPWIRFTQSTGRGSPPPSEGLPAPPRCAAPPQADWTAARRRQTPETDWSRRSWAAEESAGGRWWRWVRQVPLPAPPPLPSLGGVLCAAPKSVENTEDVEVIVHLLMSVELFSILMWIVLKLFNICHNFIFSAFFLFGSWNVRLQFFCFV